MASAGKGASQPPLDMKVSAPPTADLPGQFQARTLQPRALQAIAALGVFVAIFARLKVDPRAGPR